jgi:uncharacterized protein YdcH (DUF465 family)
MTDDEYNILFHSTQANTSAFKRLMDCDAEVIKMIEAAVESESTQSQELFGKTEELEAEIKRLQERQWVGLTATEIHDTDGYAETREMYRFALAIEAKLKEKNCG